ncbi:MAG: glycosyltransferase, partial [Bacteroidota bacterium]
RLAHPPMNSSPRVTTVTPSFNRGRFLPKTLQGVPAQKYESLEYIVTDGGFAGGSPQILP